MKQLSLFKELKRNQFGGDLLVGKRKNRRPLSTKHPIHLVLRSKGPGLIAKRKEIDLELRKAARKWGVRIYRQAIVHDHIHLLIKIPHRIAYRNFIQRLTGVLTNRLSIRWLQRPFTRIANWGKDFRQLCGYFTQNTLEALGQIPYQPRGQGARQRKRQLCRRETYEPSAAEWHEVFASLAT